MDGFLLSAAAFMVVGGLGFWALTAILLVLAIWSTDVEKPGVVTGLLVLYALILGVTGSFNVIDWIVHNPVKLAMYLAGYVVIGVAWAWIRWEFFTNDVERRYNMVRRDYLTAQKLDELVSDEQKAEFKRYAKNQGFGTDVIPVRVTRNKGRLIMWMTYWPLSIAWSGLTRPVKFVKAVFDFCYNNIGGFLQHRANAKFAKYSELN